MKTNIVVLITVGLISFSFYQNNDPSSQDLKTACTVLSKLTNEAILKNRKDLVAIYYNAYMALKSEHNFVDNCDTYFNQIKTTHSANIGDWSIGMGFPPKKYILSGSGGFTHKDFETLNKISINGILDTDIDNLKKINSMKITDKDIDQIIFYKTLQKGIVDIDVLKNSNSEDTKILKEKLNTLDLKNITPAKLNNLSKESYEVKEFKEAIK